MTPTVPLGYRLVGVHCGIKRNPTNNDLTLIVSELPATAAGVYTQNLVFGAPVGWNRKLTPAADVRVIVINSGVSNACTGERGDRDAAEMARLAAEAVGRVSHPSGSMSPSVRAEQTLVMSTGVIGTYLPMDKIAGGISAAAAKLGNDEAALVAAARGMMTTDTRHKLSGRTLTIRGRATHVCGLAKGAAMIGPNMATMLCAVLTDAALAPDVAQSVLRDAVNDSFNCISVEGHMSTSDTVLLLANGAACADRLAGSDLAELAAAVRDVCTDLAKQIVSDGEGAGHFITIDVAGCASRADAHRIAKTIGESALVKTAIAGADPNWGRVVSAAGYAGPRFDPRGVSLKINGMLLYEKGGPVPFEAKAVSQSIRANRDTHVELSLSEGNGQVRFWTTDLTAEYVRLNADYTT
jgi:glutamate N-acetyltransferase/amino-acid N-acetyltransferase